jgi:hypothetical protein
MKFSVLANLVCRDKKSNENLSLIGQSSGMENNKSSGSHKLKISGVLAVSADRFPTQLSD